jgi:hypothetical protein
MIPPSTVYQVLGSKLITPLRIKKTMGKIEKPKTIIDLKECLISKATCKRETLSGLILCSKLRDSKWLQTAKNKGAKPKYRSKKYPKERPNNVK